MNADQKLAANKRETRESIAVELRMSSEEPVLFEVRDNVAHVTLNRPHAGNSLDLGMAKELMTVALECERDKNVRAVLLRGAGNNFCMGGDVKLFHVQADLKSYLREITSYLHLAVSRF